MPFLFKLQLVSNRLLFLPSQCVWCGTSSNCTPKLWIKYCFIIVKFWLMFLYCVSVYSTFKHLTVLPWVKTWNGSWRRFIFPQWWLCDQPASNHFHLVSRCIIKIWCSFIDLRKGIVIFHAEALVEVRFRPLFPPS